VCSDRVGRKTGVGLVCELHNAGIVVLEWGRNSDWLVCGLVIAGFVVLEWEV
jgi:hypothetical protein